MKAAGHRRSIPLRVRAVPYLSPWRWMREIYDQADGIVNSSGLRAFGSLVRGRIPRPGIPAQFSGDLKTWDRASPFAVRVQQMRFRQMPGPKFGMQWR